MSESASNDRTAKQAAHSDLIAAALRQHEACAAALSTDSVTLDSPGSSFTLPPPDSFAGYQIVREIHRGGQGVVFQALQKSTNRKVAIKVMREGPFAGSGDRARFDREVQILGQLKHPNIVTIHDTGVAAGCYFFVMDYISGQPLDVYMASGARGVDDTLRLFARICEAVNAAHLRGIIHRDLKPGNIRIDNDGQPHVLDFGLAKVAVAGSIGVSPVGGPAMTVTGQFIGSLPWASPEQAEGAPDKIDVRTDVYSLGVILFQMLTGKFPYEVIGNMRDVLDRIMRAAPIRPRDIRREINDELETIVLKCLSKERERRYQSAGELGRDVERYLRGEPIEAKRDSLGYLVRKQMQRHRVPILLAISFVVLLATGLISSLILWRQAESARRGERRQTEIAQEALKASEQARSAEQEQRTAAQINAAEAARQAAIANAANKFLNDMLAKANRAEQRGDPNVTVRAVLDAAADDLDVGGKPDVPEVEAAVRHTIGTTYSALGLYDQAERMLSEALRIRIDVLGEDCTAVAETQCSLATVLQLTRRFADSEVLVRRALTTYRQRLGDKSPAVASCMHDLGVVLESLGRYDEAETVFRDTLALDLELRGPEHECVAASMGGLGSLLRQRGNLAAAEPFLRDALELDRKLFGNQHHRVATSLSEYATLLEDKGDFKAAADRYREALSIYQTILGGEHPFVATVMNNLAGVLREASDFAAAESHYRAALALRRQIYGDDSPAVAESLNNLGSLLQEQGVFDAAEPLLRQALDIRRTSLGEYHEAVADSLHNLASLLERKGQPRAAEPLYHAALDSYRRVLGPENLKAAITLDALAQLHIAANDAASAEPLLREALAIRRKLLAADHSDVAASLNSLACVLRQRGEKVDAEQMFRDVLAIRRKRLGADHPEVANTLNDLAGTLVDQRDFVAAEPLYLEALDIQRRKLGHSHPDVAAILNNLAGMKYTARDYLAAEPLFRESLAIMQGALPTGHWHITVVQYRLAQTLIELSRYADAEPLLVEAASRLASGQDAPRGLLELNERALVRLYDEWHIAEPDKGYDAKATEWRAKLVEWQASTQPASAATSQTANEAAP
ncbi:MAG: Serine/threonine-protein kinase PknD [Phycisphaerae bacterium]|nr:Serine/threonine-protein kinase PknD [Phycisphaerae bacterium]